MRGMAYVLGVAGLSVGAPTVEGADSAPPRITCGQKACTAARLPPILGDREVLGYVKSGLTTTLLFTLTTKDRAGQKQRAHAAVVVRFEPWEEFFDVEIGGRAPSRTRVPSPAALDGWWRDLTLRFDAPHAPLPNASLDVDVIPFSEADEADARRWYAESLRARDGAARTNDNRRVEPLGQIIDALTLGSIKRRGVLQFSWSAAIEASP
jgi:hypothetical protein